MSQQGRSDRCGLLYITMQRWKWLFIAVGTSSDHNATWSDITGVTLTCWYINNNRLSKEFLLLGDKQDRREHHIP